MKNIDPKTITIKRALCPFCSFGCEFGIIFNDFGIKGVEYVKDGNSNGRLCPRGSAAAMYLDHPRRSTMPLKSGKAVVWSKMAKELRKVVGSPKSVAVTFDRNVTPEEYAAIVGFCDSVGIGYTASTYFEPEHNLRPFLEKPFAPADLDKAKIAFVLGDIFNQAPMSSRAIIEWKMKDKKNELIAIDSLNTHTAGFASQFLRVNIGTEPLLLLALAQENLDGVDIAKVTGIDARVVKELSNKIKNSSKGVIFASLPFGHTYDPGLYAESLDRMHEFSGMKVVPFVEFAGYEGSQPFVSIMEMVKRKKIKNLINFGELFPFYYPQLAGSLKGLNIYATSTLKHTDHTLLPVPLSLEKEGTVVTTFGKRKLTGNIEPPSGAKSVEAILSMLSSGSSTGKMPHAVEKKIDVKERARRIAEITETKKKSFKLVGEKVAYNFLGFLEGEILKINPYDATELGIGADDIVTIKSKYDAADLPVRITEDVDQGLLAAPAETPAVRGLFEYEIDSELQAVNFIPTEVKICRKG
ncbi:MAG: hypothetical protein JSV53_11670 [candidate division WOR-3 bacterium]|nr:MAG: hypothetical protein JSV53_11670 [candidate division WOR-3 bacterium]